MATQESLISRRDEAFGRIEQVIGRVATPHGVKHGALQNIRHDDPEVAAVMRVETLAKILGEVADAQDKATADAKVAKQPATQAIPAEITIDTSAKAKG